MRVPREGRLVWSGNPRSRLSYPGDIGGAGRLVSQSGPGEQQIPEAVQVREYLDAHFAAADQAGHGAFGPAADGAGQVEAGGQFGSGGQHEVAQRAGARGGFVDPGLETLDGLGAQRRQVLGGARTGRRGQLGADDEEFALQRFEAAGQRVVRVGAAAEESAPGWDRTTPL